MQNVLSVIQASTLYFQKNGVESPRLNIEHLLAHVLGKKRMELYLEFDRPLGDAELEPLRALVRRRAGGEPLQHLLGTAEFHGRIFTCDKRALIPRPETEGLVVRAIDLCRHLESPRIADVGTGSGAIAVALAKHLPKAHLVATDISADALAVAQANVTRHAFDSRIELVGCDLLDSPSAAGPFDCIVSNPPYVRADEFAGLPRDVRDHEPKSALVAGPTGVEVVERLVEAAESRLATGGWLLVEIGPATAAAAEGIIARRPGLVPGPTLADMAGLPRIVQARKL